MILWIAGAFGAGRVFLDHARSGGESASRYSALERSLLFRTAHPGMALPLLSGILAALILVFVKPL